MLKRQTHPYTNSIFHENDPVHPNCNYIRNRSEYFCGELDYIAEYIRKQLQSDIAEDQIGLKEYFDPFTGEQNKKA